MGNALAGDDIVNYSIAAHKTAVSCYRLRPFPFPFPLGFWAAASGPRTPCGWLVGVAVLCWPFSRP